MTRPRVSLRLAFPAGLLFALSACGGGNARTTISAAGSAALVPLVKHAALDYEAGHPGVTISVAGGGSRTGIARVARKAVDLGDSDIPAVDQPALVDHEVAALRVKGEIRYEHIYTNGQPSAQIAGFIDFIENDTALLRRLHFLPVSAAHS